MYKRQVRQEPARPLLLHVPGRVRHLVLVAEHAHPRGAAHPDRALHGTASATRPCDHRRRGRVAHGRARRHLDRACARRRAADRGAGRDGARRHHRRWPLDRDQRWAAALPRRQRDHLEPALGLHRARPAQSVGRRTHARPGEPQQAVDARDRRRQHARHHPGHRRALGARLRRHRGGARLYPHLPHHVRLRRPHCRRQCAGRESGGARCRPPDHGDLLSRRRLRGSCRHGRGGGGAGPHQCEPRCGLRLHRHPGRVPRAP